MISKALHLASNVILGGTAMAIVVAFWAHDRWRSHHNNFGFGPPLWPEDPRRSADWYGSTSPRSGGL